MRPLVLCLIVLATAAMPLSAWADDPVATLVRADGGRIALSAADLEAIGMVELTSRLIGEAPEPHRVRGPLLRDVLARYGIDTDEVTVTAIDRYEADLPTADFERYAVILAIEVDGSRIGVRDKGPARIVYPMGDHAELNTPLHEGRSVWQVAEIREH